MYVLSDRTYTAVGFVVTVYDMSNTNRQSQLAAVAPCQGMKTALQQLQRS